MYGVLKWTLVTLFVIGMLFTVATVGKPRKPVTEGDAVASVIINGLLLTAILVWM